MARPYPTPPRPTNPSIAGHKSTIDLSDDEFAQVQADEEFCDMVRDGKYVVE